MTRRLMPAMAWLTPLCLSAAVSAAGPASSYSADPQQSRLEFVGVQAGAEFKGSFHKFSADVEFAPAALASSVLGVTPTPMTMRSAPMTAPSFNRSPGADPGACPIA